MFARSRGDKEVFPSSGSSSAAFLCHFNMILLPVLRGLFLLQMSREYRAIRGLPHEIGIYKYRYFSHNCLHTLATQIHVLPRSHTINI